ncbi:MAG: hypothetical protein ACQEQX_09300 [Thermodesulfobacteriota bacterium]
MNVQKLMEKHTSKDMHLKYLARKYIWWKEPDQAICDRHHFLAQIMTLGTIEDCGWIMQNLGENELKSVLLHPPVGVFNPRSWHFWHYKLGLADKESDIPPLPQRSFRELILNTFPQKTKMS